jgi:hypothetical protein
MASIYGAWSDYVRGQYPGGGKIPTASGSGLPTSVMNAQPGPARALPLPVTRRTGTTKQGTFQSKQPW